MAVTPKQIYTALINAGASTTQAIGIMANGIAESGLDPEAIGDNGTSFGLWQQHGQQYSTLVTGNPANDMAAQVKLLAQDGGFGAASGSTGAQAAGNFAANYEKCVGCQSGGAQYNQRVANASIVAGWLSSGAWPTSIGSSQTGGTGTSATAGASNSACLIGLNGPSIPLIGGISACLLGKSQARAIIGGALLVMSAGGVLVGLLVLAAAGFRASGAGHAAGGALETVGAGVAFVPGAEAAGVAIGAAGARARRADSVSSAGRQSLERRQQRRTTAASQQAQQQRAAASQQRAAETRQRRESLAAERRERYERGTVTTEKRTPLGGQIGGTKRTVTRRPGPVRRAS